MSELTRQDLAEYSRSVEESNNRLSSAMKEVAFQLGTIAQQLQQLARNDEAIIEQQANLNGAVDNSTMPVLNKVAEACNQIKDVQGLIEKQNEKLSGISIDLIKTQGNKVLYMNMILSTMILGLTLIKIFYR